jgi:hypothetical protein
MMFASRVLRGVRPRTAREPKKQDVHLLGHAHQIKVSVNNNNNNKMKKNRTDSNNCTCSSRKRKESSEGRSSHPYRRMTSSVNFLHPSSYNLLSKTSSKNSFKQFLIRSHQEDPLDQRRPKHLRQRPQPQRLLFRLFRKGKF